MGLDQQISRERKILRTHLSGKDREKHRKVYKKLLARRYPDPTAPLSGQGIERQVNVEARMQYDPAERASDQRVKDIPAWFEDYTAKSAGLRDSTLGAFNSAADKTRTAAVSGQARSAADSDALMAQMTADATRRGATVDPTIRQTADQAAASRRSAAEAFAGQLGGQGAVAVKGFNTRIDIGNRDSIDQRVKESRRRAAIAQERGQFKTKRIGELREGERKYALENAAFGVDQQQATNDALYDEAKLDIAQQNADSSQQRADWATSPDNPDNQAKPGKGGGRTPSNKEKWATNSQKALGKVKSRVKKGAMTDKDGARLFRLVPKNEDKLANLVQATVGDELLAKAIAQQTIWGGIGPGMEDALRKKFRMPIKSLGFKRSPKIK